ncbi:1365_t:CDS:1, partial [Cetraspora pellucida]
MIRKLSWLLVFLAIVSMVCAFPYHLNKRSTAFAPCDSHTPVISNVTFSPEPPIAGSNLRVKGSATKTNIEEGDLFIFEIFNTTDSKLATLVLEGPAVDICAKTKCPTNTFIFNEKYDLSNVTSLPLNYVIEISIEPGNRDPTKKKACAYW